MTTVLVLRRGVHGMPVEAYAAELGDRLPAHEVRRARTPREERELITDARIVTGLDLSPELLADADAIELFQCLYAGTDHLPLEELAAREVAVTSAAGVHGPNVAEWVVGMILVFARRIHEGIRRASRAEWRHYRANELHGSTVTIVGLGSIGTAVVERLAGFGVDTIGVRYTPSKGGPTDEVFGFDEDDLHEAFSRTDYLVLACPLTDETRGLVDQAAIKTLPPSAVIVNIARGPVIETDALVSGLRSNLLRGAALDVTDPEPLPSDHPLWSLENVLITPHNAGHTPAYYARVAEILADNVTRIERTGSAGELRNQVLPR